MQFLQTLPDCLLKQRLQTLSEIYAEANQAVQDFSVSSGLGCPFGCGSCCEDFIPDVLPVEASMVAVFLASTHPQLAYQIAAGGLEPLQFSGGRRGCPLYAQDNPYHCGVYESRPLICRLFPFASSRDKHGELQFSPCTKMPATSQAGDRLLWADSAPSMSDFGYKILTIDPDRGNQRQALHELLPRSLAEVLFLIGLNPSTDPNSTDPGFTPLPRAG